MTTFPNCPRILKGGIVFIYSEATQVRRIISLQYNANSLSRTLQFKALEFVPNSMNLQA